MPDKKTIPKRMKKPVVKKPIAKKKPARSAREERLRRTSE